MRDSYLVYDESWQKVVKPYMVMGESYGEGASYFSNELVLRGEQFNVKYVVSGYSGEYVVLDNVSMDENIRLIFRRKTE